MVEQCAHNKYLCINPIAASISTFVILIHSFVFPNSFVLHTHMYICKCGQNRSGRNHSQ